MQINQALKQLIEKWRGTSSHSDIEELKSELLHDSGFIQKLAKAVGRGS